jgi:hypothetical protein
MNVALPPSIVTTVDERDFALAAEVIEAGRIAKLLRTHPDAKPEAVAAANARFLSAQAAFLEARDMEAA